MRKSSKALCGLLLVCATGYAARANSVTFTTLAGSDSDGPLAATVEFTTVNGGLDIEITNTETGSFSIGQGVSSLAFTLIGVATPSAFTSISGVEFSPPSPPASWTLADGTSVNPTGGPAIDHWGFSTSGAHVLLATAGSPVSGGKPDHLILPSSGTVGPGGSLSGNHVPDFIGPTDFFLTVSGITSSTLLSSINFSNVSVGFGTGPDGGLLVGPPTIGGGTPPPSPSTPLPAAVWGGSALLLGVIGKRAVRRKA